MPTFVSMIRGINVGGARPVRMASLRGIYEGLGFEGVETYLQSGNVVFRAAKAGASRHAAAIERAILGSCGFEVPVAVRTPEEMSAAVAANPFLGRRSIDAQFPPRGLPDRGGRHAVPGGAPSFRSVRARTRPWRGTSSMCIVLTDMVRRRSTTASSRGSFRSVRPRGTGAPWSPLSGWPAACPPER